MGRQALLQCVCRRDASDYAVEDQGEQVKRKRPLKSRVEAITPAIMRLSHAWHCYIFIASNENALISQDNNHTARQPPKLTRTGKALHLRKI